MSFAGTYYRKNLIFINGDHNLLNKTMNDSGEVRKCGHLRENFRKYAPYTFGLSEFW